jgi:hypothetical protein
MATWPVIQFPVTGSGGGLVPNQTSIRERRSQYQTMVQQTMDIPEQTVQEQPLSSYMTQEQNIIVSQLNSTISSQQRSIINQMLNVESIENYETLIFYLNNSLTPTQQRFLDQLSGSFTSSEERELVITRLSQKITV